MLIAIISDIHSNELALDACLRQCEALGVQRLVFLGDLVGYGPDPMPVVTRVAALTEAGALTILGNHDEAVFEAKPDMNDAAMQAIIWTRARLDAGAGRFLKSLPLTATLDDVLFVHADASEPARWHYVTEDTSAQRSFAATTARVTICGHVHVPHLFCLTAAGRVVPHRPATGACIPLGQRHRWLAVAGAAGQPRDGNPAASFLTYVTSTRELVYRRAAYDTEATAARIRAAGLPDILAERLLMGR